MSSEPVNGSEAPPLDPDAEEVLRRGRPLPSLEEMAISDLDEEEGAAFLAVLKK